MSAISVGWTVADAVAFIGYLAYVIVTGNGPRHLIVSSIAAFFGTLAVVALVAGALFLVIR